MRMTDANLTKRIIDNADRCVNYSKSLMFWGVLRSLVDKFGIPGDYKIENNQLCFRAFEHQKSVLFGLNTKYPDLVSYSDTHGLNSGTIRDVYKLIKAMEKDFAVSDVTCS